MPPGDGAPEKGLGWRGTSLPEAAGRPGTLRLCSLSIGSPARKEKQKAANSPKSVKIQVVLIYEIHILGGRKGRK